MRDDELDKNLGDSEYQVLARKYRPKDFATLIGQDAMVRTLTNAFKSGRLAHAFILTGVRGVGKTTTARIIARALNCIGPDGSGDATIEPCGECEPCQAITEDRLVDVMEMDAASRTGVDDIRELIEGIRYKPVSARYKVYIIDEVHMLSRNAFNALLKTLEEPPAHVKFIFATTEIRQVPVTVMSRCQRFDLRRVNIETLSSNFKWIAEKEGIAITDEAIALIARAADGSVRDGQSLLDQVIATGLKESQNLDREFVREMLGLVNRSRSLDLIEFVMSGEITRALEILDSDYAKGGDPFLILHDLLEVIHSLVRIKVVSQTADSALVSDENVDRSRDISKRLSMASLTRAWQMLLKGVGELQSAPSPIKAAEMILIRMAYLAELPSPVDAVKSINGVSDRGLESSSPIPGEHTGGSQNSQIQLASPAQIKEEVFANTKIREHGLASPNSFEEVIALADQMNERILRANLINNVHLIRFEPGNIVFNPGKNMPREFSQDLTRFLNDYTDSRWMVTMSLDEQGSETFQQREEAEEISQLREIKNIPFVRSVFEIFPGAEISNVKDIADNEEFLGAEQDVNMDYVNDAVGIEGK